MKVLSLTFIILLVIIFNRCNYEFKSKNHKSKQFSYLVDSQIGKSILIDSLNLKTNYKIIKFIGKLVSNKKYYKILTYFSEWGVNHHSTGVILIYDEKNHCTGCYYLGSGKDLQVHIENPYFLIFDNSDKSDYDKKIVTRVSFKDSIPNSIFIECQNKSGDLYILEKANSKIDELILNSFITN